MWNYLKGYFRSGELFKKIYWVFVTLLCSFIALASMPIGLLIFGAPAVLLIKHTAERFAHDQVVPYWGDKFLKSEIYRLLAGEKFRPYVTSKGKKVKDVQVSSSGRWVYIKGKYYPLALVKRFDFRSHDDKCFVYMIDGAGIGKQEWSGNKMITEALKELTGTVSDYPEEICKEAFDAVKADMHLSTSRFATADWNEFRYQWEQKCRAKFNGIEKGNLGKKRIKTLISPDNIKPVFFKKTLTDLEIASICEGIKTGKVNNGDAFADIKRYTKDIYVLNGVKLYEKLGYPDNLKAEDFLFDCIRDIEKPYFDDAIRVLSEFPREHLIASIERYVKKAHDDGDYVFGAGLIALARAINYEISLEKEASEALSAEDAKEFEAAAQGEQQQGAVAVKFQA